VALRGAGEAVLLVKGKRVASLLSRLERECGFRQQNRRPARIHKGPGRSFRWTVGIGL